MTAFFKRWLKTYRIFRWMTWVVSFNQIHHVSTWGHCGSIRLIRSFTRALVEATSRRHFTNNHKKGNQHEENISLFSPPPLAVTSNSIWLGHFIRDSEEEVDATFKKRLWCFVSGRGKRTLDWGTTTQTRLVSLTVSDDVTIECAGGRSGCLANRVCLPHEGTVSRKRSISKSLTSFHVRKPWLIFTEMKWPVSTHACFESLKILQRSNQYLGFYGSDVFATDSEWGKRLTGRKSKNIGLKWT